MSDSMSFLYDPEHRITITSPLTFTKEAEWEIIQVLVKHFGRLGRVPSTTLNIQENMDRGLYLEPMLNEQQAREMGRDACRVELPTLVDCEHFLMTLDGAIKRWEMKKEIAQNEIERLVKRLERMYDRE